MAAITKVLSLFEILENIIVQVSHDKSSGYDMVKLQRVCRRWRDVIKESTPIQQAMVVAPYKLPGTLFNWGVCYPRALKTHPVLNITTTQNLHFLKKFHPQTIMIRPEDWPMLAPVLDDFATSPPCHAISLCLSSVDSGTKHRRIYIDTGVKINDIRQFYLTYKDTLTKQGEFRITMSEDKGVWPPHEDAVFGVTLHDPRVPSGLWLPEHNPLSPEGIIFIRD